MASKFQQGFKAFETLLGIEKWLATQSRNEFKARFKAFETLLGIEKPISDSFCHRY